MSDDGPEWKFLILSWAEEWLKDSMAPYNCDTSSRGLTSSQRKCKFSEINFISLIYLSGLNETAQTG